MKGKILINKQLVEVLSKESIACYLYLKGLAIEGHDKMVVSNKMIEWNLLGEKPTLDFHKKIRKGMKELYDNNLIFIVEEISKNEFFLDLSRMIDFEKNRMCLAIYFDELLKIFKSKSTCNKFNVLFYYICILETFDRNSKQEKYQYKIGYMDAEYINRMSGIHKNTAIKYLHLLENEKILYVIRHTQCYKTTNKFGVDETKYFTNTYSRYKDKELCILYDKECRGFNNKEIGYDANRSRSLIQKYTLFSKGKEYDLSTLEEIYKEVIQWNKRKKEAYNEAIKNNKKASIPEYKDISIFKNYEFYKGDEINEC